RQPYARWLSYRLWTLADPRQKSAAFALPDGVPCQCDEALCGEGTKHLLPGRVGLASTLMPQGIKDRWVGRMAGCWQIEVRSYVELRLTLEDDFLDSVPRPL